MTIRTEEEWQQLLASQPSCGLSVKDFCRKHQISTSTFYKRGARPELLQAVNDFVKITSIVETPAMPEATVVISVVTQSETISLQTSVGIFSFPCSLPASYMATLIRELLPC
ncbi:transposase [Shewanella sp. D64]|uniref:IS66 family insertion sequence element accessory protein TnpA n=1 Tax=unclassified Shewanella TaxID=196818 RepID=UPI0022BA42D5|nr:MULTISPECIES: hypothetical protein [unclassified Shewanella]MEC4728958.1 transposase [Shewanella sp. D64]MEC4740811.1 transposase [Shewanella sp. E94]WBJ96693.1 transposase [Shewanella sp. MTB7]